MMLPDHIPVPPFLITTLGVIFVSKRRGERLAEEIKREISAIIRDNIKDPRIDPVATSITRVEVSNDLGHARVFFSVLGDEQKCGDTAAALDGAQGYIRTLVAGKLELRHAPEIVFQLDRSIEHGIRISAILDKLKEEKSEDTP